jgi:isoquinoline 1-oxidoreductase beta subunit
MKIIPPFQKKPADVRSEIFMASRRDFLKIGGLVAGGLALGVNFFSCNEKGKKIATLAPSVYLTINPDGEVIIVAHRSEMGTGIRTSLPLVVADELGADWSRVRVVQAEGDEKKYGNQNTDGSFSIRMFYLPMRQAGATARYMLIQAAAQKWAVKPEECDTDNGQVVHKASGKTAPFGDLVEAASAGAMPSPDLLKLKDPGQFKMIGHETPIIDLHDIVTGKAVFGIDAAVDNMKYAAIKRSPVVGGKIKSYNGDKAMAVPGVLKVIPIKGGDIPPTIFKPLSGVAVVAENTWAAIKGRDLLEVEWDLGPNAGYDSAAQIDELKKEIVKKGTVRRTRGDFDQAKKNATKVIEHTYVAPYMAHGMIETPTALAVVKNGRCEVWACTQNPQGARDSLAQELGLSAENVRVNVTLLGGAFGRKSKPDFIVEAALLAKECGFPVKVQWTREDDIHHDFYHALSVQRVVATIDAHNKLSGWNHHIAYPSIGATFDASVIQPTDGELAQGALDFPYDVPAIKVETHDATSHIRVGWLRSVRNIPQAFAVGTMLDEIAEARKMDPIANSLDLLGADRSITFNSEIPKGSYPNYNEDIARYPWETGRLKRVIETVGRDAGWGKTFPKGSAMGFAAHRSFLTYTACIVEVKVQDNNISIPNVYYALDCGTPVNLDRIKSQFEGGAQFATSIALKSEITVKNGQVEQNNFDAYKIIRMPESPKKIHVSIIESHDKPTGVGEPPVPAYTPALCNAIYAATGKRIYKLPVDLGA